MKRLLTRLACPLNWVIFVQPTIYPKNKKGSFRQIKAQNMYLAAVIKSKPTSPIIKPADVELEGKVFHAIIGQTPSVSALELRWWYRVWSEFIPMFHFSSKKWVSGIGYLTAEHLRKEYRATCSSFDQYGFISQALTRPWANCKPSRAYLGSRFVDPSSNSLRCPVTL